LKNIYKSQTFTNWIVYNDQMKKVDKKTAHGNAHAKGLVAWNDVKISWLCHSVPEFPSVFNGENGEISDIDQSELVYGQSFQYVEIPYHNDKLCDIMNQLYIMEVNIVEEKNHLTFPKRKNNAINTLILSDTVTHIAKSPKHQIDIYSQFIVIQYPHLWKVETWVRGHLIESEIPISLRRVRDIKKINYKDVCYNESQDHSKWAVSDSSFYCVGDLNRMTSQYNRGGGGFICDNKDIAHSLRELICKDDSISISI
jgi:deoxyribonuclease-2